MKCPVYIVFTLTRNIYTKAITEVTMLNCFATLPQAKASLQYEYDIAIAENCNPLDETDRPVWLNDDHTELKLAPGYDPSYETIVYIDSSVHFHDVNEPCFDYHNDDGLPVVNYANYPNNTRESVVAIKDTDDEVWFSHPDNPNQPRKD